MTSVFEFVKIVSIIQLCLIVSSFFVIYFTHFYFIIKQTREKKIIHKLHQLFHSILKDNKKLGFNDIKFCKKNIYEVLTVLSDTNNVNDLNTLINQLLYDVFIPIGRKFYNARNWYNRYLATRCYLYGYAEEDRPYIQKLIFDRISLVSINGGKIAVDFQDKFLLFSMLDRASLKRRIQQAVYIHLILVGKNDISSLIIEKLINEENLYTKILCYKILSELPPKSELTSTLKRDMALHNTDLDIAILNYIANSHAPEKNKLIFNYHYENEPQVKIVVAKLLAESDSDESYALLEKMLKDANWWVRLNAATSLKSMGEKGIAILKKQSPEIDKYAHDVAIHVLTQ